MWSYQRNPSWGWDHSAEDLAGGMLAALFTIFFWIAAVVSTLVMAATLEIFRIYATRAFISGRLARFLWWSLGLYGCFMLIGIAAAVGSTTQGLGFFTIICASTLFLLAVEIADLAAKMEPVRTLSP